MKLSYFAMAISAFAFVASPTYAANVGDVVINEIAWMGTANSHFDEWIELYNNTNAPISLDGWVLQSTTDGRPAITLAGSISARNFFLLERTDETSVPDQQADQIYVGDLKNSGERLELKDEQGNIIDDVNSLGEWFAGYNIEPTERKTMERKNPALAGDFTNWGTSIPIGGTPKSQNSVYSAQESQISDLATAPGPAQEPQTLSEMTSATTTSPQPPQLPKGSEGTQRDGGEVTETAPIYPSNIFINELMPYPFGPDELEEWIEITNENNEPADISLWQIKDTLGATYIYTLPMGTLVAANSFIVLSRLTTKITMNNDNDAIQLVRPDGELVQTVPYEKAPRGKSYVRVEGIWKWSAIPTPGSANILPAPPKDIGTISDVKVAVKKVSPNEVIAEAAEASTTKQTASVGQTSTVKLSSRATVFIASFIALISAVFIFFLKKRLA
jgi:hypothetical protein